jgi:hypothetical protein
MARSPREMRAVLLVEDKHQERFVRALLVRLGFEVRRLRFKISPSGRGSAENWVRKRYPDEVALLRRSRHQRNLCLLAMRDGDRQGVGARQRELDDELSTQGQEPRAANERIAAPVPTWNIETWLAAMQGPRRRPEAGRPWLRRVASNAVRMMQRGERRRKERETSVARPEDAHASVTPRRERSPADKVALFRSLLVGRPRRLPESWAVDRLQRRECTGR